uniref:VWA domain-containing protein n=1 Tax=Archaeoglobus fulgidus TaxID=2234 RepID=A0A7C3RC65_ARCFL
MCMRRDERGVSMLLEYLILISVLSVFVFLLSLNVKEILEESQIDIVVENQFSDVAAEVSSQIVDSLAVHPKNGYIKAKVFMPERIGDIEYTVSLENESVVITSESGRFKKALSLGAAGILKLDLTGQTYSLAEKHELNYEKITPTYPSAVLKLKPASVLANETTAGCFEVDVSKSSARGVYNWIIELWNGSIIRGDSGNTVREICVYWDGLEFNYYCYNESGGLIVDTAWCNLTLTVTDTRGLSDTDNATILISKIPEVEPSLYIKKFVNPPQTEPGKPVELHIYLNGRGFRTEGTNLSVVTVIDTSGSMRDPTYYSNFAGNVTPQVWEVVHYINSSWKNSEIIVTLSSPDSMSPWWDGYDKDDAFVMDVYQADGDYYRVIPSDSNELESVNGIFFYDSDVKQQEIGNWSFKSVVAIPKPIPLELKFYKWIRYSWVLQEKFSTNYIPSYYVHQIELPSGYTANDQFKYLDVELYSPYRNDFFVWLDNNFCKNGVCRVSDIAAGMHNLYIAPRLPDARQFEGALYIQKLDSAKIASIDFIEETVGEGDYIGLVSFATTATKHAVNSSPFLTYLTTDRSVVVEKVKELNEGGWTNIYQALAYARDVLLENTTYTNGTLPLIVFMTDGRPTCKYLGGDYSSSSYSCSETVCGDNDQICYNQIIPLADEIKNTVIGENNITICTVGFGKSGDYNADLLRDMASYKPGSNEKCFYEARNYQELSRAFMDISRIFRIAAKNVTVRDVIPDNIRLLGAELTISGNANCTDVSLNEVENGTMVSFNCGEIYIDDEIELIVRIVADEPGTYFLDIPVVSNVTYEYYPFGGNYIDTVYLDVVAVRYGGSERATVRIE